MRPLGAISALFLLAAAASPATAQVDRHPKSIVILTALSKDAAFGRVASALVDAGYVVGEANPVGIATTRRTFSNVWDLQIHVNILPSADSTRLVVTGTYWITCCDMFKLDNQAVEGGRSGIAGRMWRELTVAADSIRKAVTLSTAGAADSTRPQ